MFLSNSRYATSPLLATPPGGGPPLVRPRAITTLSGAVQHTVAAGDRADALAFNYYADPRAWWRILDANPQLEFGGQIMGLQGRPISIPPGA
jgi:phage tail protein X